MPDCAFSFYDVVCAFDHHTEIAHIISTGLPLEDGHQRSARARSRADAFEQALSDTRPSPVGISRIARGSWQSNFSRPDYIAAVKQVIDAILAGDIFQANISQRFTAALPKDYDAWAFYQRLRKTNPAPFAAFLERGSTAIASSSPERFVRISGPDVETRPIKGTARRSPDPAEDQFAANALLGSEKDRAENLMIVDLLRNDLSRVCLPHSVNTPALCALESYAGVHHLVSTVTGRLRPGMSAVDLIAAAFPGGSITGAPKIKAMELISNIEREQRGVYCGSIGFFGFNGQCDTNIAIRTVLFQQGTAAFQAGGGITALSEPEDEYLETLAKADRVLQAFCDDEIA